MIARGTKHNQAIKLILLGSLVANLVSKKRFDSTTVSGWLTVLLCAIPAMHNVLYGIAYGWQEPFKCFLSICSNVLIIHAFFYCNPDVYGTTWVINPVLPATVCLARLIAPRVGPSRSFLLHDTDPSRIISVLHQKNEFTKKNCGWEKSTKQKKLPSHYYYYTYSTCTVV